MNKISVGKVDKFCWIRCGAKGNFQNSPLIKEWVTARLAEVLDTLVVDLELCTGMDSTFMGNLAGMATQLTAVGGSLQIVDASEKCIKLLDDLGLAPLMEINPDEASWTLCKDSIRKKLEVIEVVSQEDKTNHVYEMHKKLCEVDTKNIDKFSSVLECLEKDLYNRG